MTAEFRCLRVSGPVGMIEAASGTFVTDAALSSDVVVCVQKSLFVLRRCLPSD